MARILLNMSSQPAGTHAGVARFAMELSRRLIERGKHDYVFRSQWTPEQLPAGIAQGAEIETIPPITNFLKEFILSSVKAPGNYPASKYDLILNLDALGLAGGGRRRMTIVHDIYFRTLPAMSSAFHRFKSQLIHQLIISRSALIVGISEATSSEVRRCFPRDASKVRTILSDASAGAAPDGKLPEGLERERYVLAVANVTPNKNFGVLAQAFARVAAKDPGLKLVHVGGDEGETFETHLRPLGVEDRLVRLRGIPDATLATLYAQAACLCVPSLAEGFCLPIIEAQRLDCPVVFSDRSACAEVGGKGGVAFDAKDVDALERALASVTSTPQVRETMRIAGRENAARFSWDRTVDQYEDAILAAMSREK